MQQPTVDPLHVERIDDGGRREVKAPFELQLASTFGVLIVDHGRGLYDHAHSTAMRAAPIFKRPRPLSKLLEI